MVQGSSTGSKFTYIYGEKHVSGLPSSFRQELVNHSTRKHLVQKLVEPNEFVQITGHKNVNSLNSYSAISDRRQQHTSTVLSRRRESSTSVATSSSPKVTVDEITSVSTVQLSTSAGTLPFLYKFAESKRQRF